MKRVSIRDIAVKAGVVPSTVSFVLNGKAKQMRISDKMAEKIKKIAEEAGYYPHHTAVSLRTGKSNIIGLIVEDISNIFFARLAKIIEDKSYSCGYRVVYCSTENDEKKGLELLKMLMNQQVDGILVTPTPGMKEELIKIAGWGKPIVLMDRFIEGTGLPHVMVDNYKGVLMAMNYLHEKGYSNIGFVTINVNQVQMNERLRGYKEGIRLNKMNDGVEYILPVNYTRKEKDSVKLITGFLKNHPQLDAVLFSTNYLGIAGLEAIRNLQLKIPENIAVICFDDHDIFKFYTPSITIIHQPIEYIAESSVELLFNQMNQPDTVVQPIEIMADPLLVIRESV